MARTKLGGVVLEENGDGTFSRKRVVFTDAIGEDGSITDEEVLAKGHEASKADGVDGAVFQSWPVKSFLTELQDMLDAQGS